MVELIRVRWAGNVASVRENTNTWGGGGGFVLGNLKIETTSKISA